MADEQGEQYQKPKKESKTIYDVGLGIIILKNFFAGFSRAAGSVLVYIMLGGVLYYVMLTYILPELKSLIPSSFPLFSPLMGQQNTTEQETAQPSSTYYVSPEQFNEAVDALKQYNSQQQ